MVKIHDKIHLDTCCWPEKFRFLWFTNLQRCETHRVVRGVHWYAQTKIAAKDYFHQVFVQLHWLNLGKKQW